MLQRLRESLVSGRAAVIGAKRTLSASTSVSAPFAAGPGDNSGCGTSGRSNGAGVVESLATRESLRSQAHASEQAYSVPVPVLLLGGLSIPPNSTALTDADRRCVRLALQPHNDYGATLTPVGGM